MISGPSAYIKVRWAQLGVFISQVVDRSSMASGLSVPRFFDSSDMFFKQKVVVTGGVDHPRVCIKWAIFP
jgi:hypothetical protein